MATLPCIIEWGQSNAEGIGQYALATDQDMNRWYGATYASIGVAFPALKTSPGIHYWQCEMPHGVDTEHAVTGATGTSVRDSLTSFNANLAKNGVAIITNQNSSLAFSGQTRGIDTLSTTTTANDTLNVAAAWGANPTTADFFTTLYGGKANGAVAGTVITNTYVSTFTAVFTANALVGKYLLVVAGTGIGQYRKITAYTDTTVTVAKAFSPALDATSYFAFLTDGTLDIDTYKGAFTDQSFYASLSPTFIRGYEYPSTRSQPKPSPLQYGTQFGPDLQLSWRLQNELNTDLWVLKLGMPSAYMSRYLGTLSWSDAAWFRDGTHNDWAPGSTAKLTSASTYDLFDVLFTTILTAAKNWVATNRPGDTLDVVGFFGMEGESDAASSDRYSYAYKNMKIIRDTARARVASLGLCSTTADRIPWIMGGINVYSGWAYRDQVNAAYAQLEADDTWSGWVDTTSFTTSGTPGHFDAVGLVALGNAWADKWISLRSRFIDADSADASRRSLVDLRAAVKARYEGNTTTTDSTDQTVNDAINNAVREITNRLGDGAWFLRRSDQFSFVADSTTTYTFPARIKRIIQIRDTTAPHTELRFNLVSYTQEGRPTITMPYGTTTSQAVWVDYIELPRDMTQDNDVCVVPYEYTELVVLLAVKRLAERGGNQMLMQLVTAQADEIWKGVWRQSHAQDRARNSGWHTDAYSGYRTDYLAGRDGPWLYP